MTLPVFDPCNFIRGLAVRPSQSMPRSFEWDDISERSDAGMDIGYGKWTFPVVHWTLDMNFLYDDKGNLFRMNQDTDLRMLEGLFNSGGGGRVGRFYFRDPDHCSTRNELIGTGDGSMTQFQLAATRGGFSIPVQSPEYLVSGVLPKLYDNGAAVSTSTFSVDGAGVVTLTSPLAESHSLTTDLDYYFLARFSDAKLGFEKFMHRLWLTRQLKVQSVKQPLSL